MTDIKRGLRRAALLHNVDDHTLKPNSKPLPKHVPVGEGMVECSVCKGGVKLTLAPFGDSFFGIRQDITLVYSAHRSGGLPSRGPANRCVASYTMPEFIEQRARAKD